ncbi:galactose-binding domain-containing protein [Aporhodopirellula aestuarii]|uniref:Carbohydrate-binding CenC domain protein n=1 Tax=Aporhodopirellula aestuarii TaxID=2950107 RepID=A0ABT0UFX9_9BACT|nr:carbohydrate-binding CenC domain protein [Aporhodopirellula aestuarii]MCM2374981.1 carbohydrate-binding CenC domain protein [Aporhodopirellula aestuarii]
MRSLRSFASCVFVSFCLLQTLSATILSFDASRRTSANGPLTRTKNASATYYVDASIGSDTNIGTSIERPLATIGAAANVARAGDSVLIRAGMYRETVTVPRSGTAESPIRFQAYQDEQVILSGCDPVTNWKRLGNSDIWEATVPPSPWPDGRGETLFVGGLLRFSAREKGEHDPLDLNRWGQIEKGQLTRESFVAHDLTGRGDDFFNGATVNFHVNDWTIERRQIADYDSATGRVTFDRPTGPISQKQRLGYYIDSSAKLLDAPREWFHKGHRIFYRTASGEDVNDFDIEVRRRAFAFDLRDRSHIILSGLTFRGASIQTNEQSNWNRYAGNRFYAYDKDNVGRFILGGSHNTFRDNEVSQTWGSALTVGHTNNQIINNYFHDIGYTGTARVVSMSGERHLVSHNTVSKFARSFLDGFPNDSEFAYNLFKDGGRLTWDTGVFDGDAGRGNGGRCIIHHNVFRSSERKGIFAAFYSGTDLVIHHNIIYDVGPNTVRHGYPNFLKYYHNTFIGPAPQMHTDVADTAVQTNINNNLMVATDRCFSLGVDCRGNHAYTPSDFISFDTFDFRLTPGSPAIDCGVVLPGINDNYTGAAPDAGALELGETMWKVGHDFRNPPTPKFQWKHLPGTNLFANGQFQFKPQMVAAESRQELTARHSTPDQTVTNGINSEEWLTEGSPTYIDGNAWNQFNIGVARFGNHAMRLLPGDSMRRTFTNLKPNTSYVVAANVKLTDRRIECSVPDEHHGTLNRGTHRGVKYVDGISPGGWICFDDVDFGVAGKYDQMELVFSRPPREPVETETLIEIRENNANGKRLGIFNAQANVHDSWYSAIADITPLEGKHRICLVPVSDNATTLRFANVRLRCSDIAPDHRFTMAARSFGRSDVKTTIGAADWLPNYESLTFTTGPTATSFELLLQNRGCYDAYLDRLAVYQHSPRKQLADDTEIQNELVDGDLVASDGEIRSGIGLDGNQWWQVSFPQTVTIGRIELSGRDRFSFKGKRHIRVTIWDRGRYQQGKLLWSKTWKADNDFWKSGVFILTGNEISENQSTRLASVPALLVRVETVGFESPTVKTLGLTNARIFADSTHPSNQNVAHRGKASQSSDHYVVDGKADLAINGDIFAAAQFTSTQFSKTPWWQVELDTSPTIDQIRIFNRTDAAERIGSFRVSVWDRHPDEGGHELWARNYFFSRGDIPPGGSLTIHGRDSDGNRRLDSVKKARVIRVQKTDNGMLSLVEVQVWAKDR